MEHRSYKAREGKPKAAGAGRQNALPNRISDKRQTQQLTYGPLLKVLTANRIGSRRQLASAIKQGKITVNGAVVENFSLPVNLKTDTILLDNKRIQPETSRRIILMFNKPAGVVTTTSDEMGRRTVIDLLPQQYQGLGLYPIGRLDKYSTGLLLITNDGDVTYRLTHPKFEQEKEYLVAVKGKLQRADLDTVRKGVLLEDGVTNPAIITEIRGQLPFNYKMIIREGKKRQIRRTFESIGQRVIALKRIRVGQIMLDTLPEGKVRELTREEIAKLGMKTAHQSVPAPERHSRRETPARKRQQS